MKKYNKKHMMPVQFKPLAGLPGGVDSPQWPILKPTREYEARVRQSSPRVKFNPEKEVIEYLKAEKWDEVLQDAEAKALPEKDIAVAWKSQEQLDSPIRDGKVPRSDVIIFASNAKKDAKALLVRQGVVKPSLQEINEVAKSIQNKAINNRKTYNLCPKGVKDGETLGAQFNPDAPMTFYEDANLDRQQRRKIGSNIELNLKHQDPQAKVRVKATKDSEGNKGYKVKIKTKDLTQMQEHVQKKLNTPSWSNATNQILTSRALDVKYKMDKETLSLHVARSDLLMLEKIFTLYSRIGDVKKACANKLRSDIIAPLYKKAEVTQTSKNTIKIKAHKSNNIMNELNNVINDKGVEIECEYHRLKKSIITLKIDSDKSWSKLIENVDRYKPRVKGG